MSDSISYYESMLYLMDEIFITYLLRTSNLHCSLALKILRFSVWLTYIKIGAGYEVTCYNSIWTCLFFRVILLLLYEIWYLHSQHEYLLLLHLLEVLFPWLIYGSLMYLFFYFLFKPSTFLDNRIIISACINFCWLGGILFIPRLSICRCL